MTDTILCRLFDLTTEVVAREPPILRYELRTDLPPGVSVGIYASRRVSPEGAAWDLYELETELQHAPEGSPIRLCGTFDIWAADRRLVESPPPRWDGAGLVHETVEVGARVYCYQPRKVLGENNRLLTGPLVTTFWGDNIIHVLHTVVIPLAPFVKTAGFC